MKYFGLFGSIGEIASHYGVTYSNASAFSRRGEVPAKYDYLTVKALHERGLVKEDNFAEALAQVTHWHSAVQEARKRNMATPAPPWLEAMEAAE